MEVKVKSRAEIIAAAAHKVARTGRSKVKVYVPPPFIPDFPIYRTTRDDSPYGPVKVFVKPHTNGGWEIFVSFLEDRIPNPVLPEDVAKALLKKIASPPAPSG
jgi:hypothetical protein